MKYIKKYLCPCTVRAKAEADLRNSPLEERISVYVGHTDQSPARGQLWHKGRFYMACRQLPSSNVLFIACTRQNTSWEFHTSRSVFK